MPEFSPTEIDNREHIAPDKTGDNIAAKKTANYVWDGVSSWVRMTQPAGGGAGSTVEITDGANVANVLKSDGSAAGENAVLTAGTYLSVPFTTTTAQAVGSTDVGNYKSVSVYVATQGGSSTITFQQSNDNNNWVPLSLTRSDSSTSAPGTSTNVANVQYNGALTARYFRLNVTGIASGTTAGTVVFSTLPPAHSTVGAAQAGTWTVQPGNTANTTAWLIAGGKTNNSATPGATNVGVLPAVANAAVQTWTEGDQVLESVDLSGNQRVTLGTLLAGEDLAAGVMKVEERFNYANMTTATTQNIKTGAGFLHSIVINTPVASATISIFDNTLGSGTTIGKITLGATLANDVYGAMLYDVSFSTGLTIVTSGATDITVSYR